LEKGDSIRNPITNKYDIIMANPPFGIDGLEYLEITHKLRDEYMPIKSNSAVPLFLQAIIYMLKVGGRCAVVLPEGQELFSKNTVLASVREYLIKTCDLKEVIYLPAGTFTHTSIKTCVFYFIKKKEGDDILETKIKYSKTTQKESGRDYKFSKTCQTNKVKFYDYNPENGGKHLLIEVDIKQLIENSYSLNYAEYLKDISDDDVYKDGIIVKTLGDVCNFDIGGTPSRNKDEYYKDGANLWVSVRELNGGYIYDTKEKLSDLGVKKSSVKLFDIGTVLFSFKLSIGKTAIVGKPLYSNEAIAGIKSKDDKILNNKYLYYYLTINDFTQKGSGMLGNGSMNKKSLSKIKIVFPPIEKQKQIVENYENIDKVIKQLEKQIDENKNKAKTFMEDIIKKTNISQDDILKDSNENDSNSDNDKNPIKKTKDINDKKVTKKVHKKKDSDSDSEYEKPIKKIKDIEDKKVIKKVAKKEAIKFENRSSDSENKKPIKKTKYMAKNKSDSDDEKPKKKEKVKNVIKKVESESDSESDFSDSSSEDEKPKKKVTKKK
jgi:type I restriction-modification system DNA methylase subunit